MNNLRQSSWTDAQLIEAIKAGGRLRNDAWQYIYKSWRPVYLKTIFDKGGKLDEAQEVLPQVMLDVQQTICKPDFALHSSTLRTYFTVALTRAWVRLRQKQSGLKLDEFDPQIHETLETESNAQQDLIWKEQAETVLFALKNLGEPCQKVLTLKGSGYSNEEVATEMQYESVQSANNAISKCRGKLRDYFKERNIAIYPFEQNQ
jgi:DNA-directed RNA polymerase specialized sigma24 family protein